jgi:biopolymer transport protein ExbB/TolQ
MGDPGKLAGNISEALVTTASGLIVALPAIFLFFHFRDKMVALVADVDKNGAKILNALRRSVLGGQQPQQQQAVTPHPPQGGQQQHPLA